MNKKTLIAIGVLVVFGLVLFTYSPKNPRDEEMKKLRFVKVTDLEDVNLVFDFTREKGYFDQHNIELEVTEINGGGLTKTLMAGKADITIEGPTTAIAGYLSSENERNVKVAGILFRPFSYFAVTKKENLEENGKILRAAVSVLNAEPDLITKYFLEKFGFDKGVSFVAIPQDTVKEKMLEKNEVDFITIKSEKFVNDNKLEDRYVVLDPSELVGSPFFRTILVSPDSLVTKEKEIASFVESVYESLDYMQNNENEVRDFMVGNYGTSPERAKQIYKRFMIASENIERKPKPDTFAPLVEMILKKFDPVPPAPGKNLSGFIL